MRVLRLAVVLAVAVACGPRPAPRAPLTALLLGVVIDPFAKRVYFARAT